MGKCAWYLRSPTSFCTSTRKSSTASADQPSTRLKRVMVMAYSPEDVASYTQAPVNKKLPSSPNFACFSKGKGKESRAQPFFFHLPSCLVLGVFGSYVQGPLEPALDGVDEALPLKNGLVLFRRDELDAAPDVAFLPAFSPAEKRRVLRIGTLPSDSMGWFGSNSSM